MPTLIPARPKRLFGSPKRNSFRLGRRRRLTPLAFTFSLLRRGVDPSLADSRAMPHRLAAEPGTGFVWEKPAMITSGAAVTRDTFLDAFGQEGRHYIDDPLPLDMEFAERL